MKVYWCHCGTRHGNFGDKLTPLLLDYFCAEYEWAGPTEAEVFGIGSIVEMVPDRFRGTVWTSGFLQATSSKSLNTAEVLAVRGKLTLERLSGDRSGPVALGDGGLLCDLFHKGGTKRYTLGIIPHYADAKDLVLREIMSKNQRIKLIDICGTVEEVIRDVGQCEHVVSSSLHGLVLSDSLCVPNRWVEFPGSAKRIFGSGFKFRDYYSIYDGLAVSPAVLSSEDDLDSLVAACANYCRTGIDVIKQNLLVTLKELVGSRPVNSGGTSWEDASMSDLDTKCGRALATVSSIGQNVGADNPASGASHEQAVRRAFAKSSLWPERFEEAERSYIEQLELTASQFKDIIPRSASAILVDQEELRSYLLPDRSPTPFLERDGGYWGPPVDDLAAIQELEKLQRSGAEFLVIAWPAFWWLQHYSAWHRHLASRFLRIFANDLLIVFNLRESLK
jgi:pyruvyltransferase